MEPTKYYCVMDEYYSDSATCATTPTIQYNCWLGSDVLIGTCQQNVPTAGKSIKNLDVIGGPYDTAILCQLQCSA